MSADVIVGRVLALTCLLVAPILGLTLGGRANAPGEGPGVLGLLLGIGIPAGASLVLARGAGRSWPHAIGWALASVAATGGLLLLAWLFVFTVIKPV